MQSLVGWGVCKQSLCFDPKMLLCIIANHQTTNSESCQNLVHKFLSNQHTYPSMKCMNAFYWTTFNFMIIIGFHVAYLADPGQPVVSPKRHNRSYKHRQYIIKIIIVIIIIKHVQAWCIIITFILRGWHLLLWSILPSGPLVTIRKQMKFLLWS